MTVISFDSRDAQQTADLIHNLTGDETWPVRDVPDFNLVNEMKIVDASALIAILSQATVDQRSRVYHHIQQAVIHNIPIILFRTASITPPPYLSAITPIDGFADMDGALNTLKTQMKQPVGSIVMRTDEFADYCLNLKTDLENQLTRSIPGLQMRDWDTAEIYTPAFSEDVSLAHHHQMIIAGEAAVGKTITLLGMAYRATLTRLHDPDAPLPVYVPIYTFDWLQGSFYGSLSRYTTRLGLLSAVIDNGGAILFLDGLNEVRRDWDDGGMPVDLRAQVLAYLRNLPVPTLSYIITAQPDDVEALRHIVEDLPYVITMQRLPGGEHPVRGLPLYRALASVLETPDFDGETDIDIQDGLIDQYIDHRAERIESKIDTEELLLDMEKVLLALLIGVTRRDYVDIWRDQFEAELGRSQATYTMTALHDLGLIIPLAKGIARFVHHHFYRYFAIDRLTHDLIEGVGAEREKAALAFGRAGFGTEYLIAAMDGATPNLQLQCAIALRHHRKPETVPALLRLLSTTLPDVQTGIIETLGLIHDERAVEPCINLLQTSEDDDLKATAAWALGQLNDGQAVDALLAATEDDDLAVVEQSILSLGNIGATRATDTIIDLLDDVDADIRIAAIRALGNIGESYTLTYLKPLVNDNNFEVRAALFRTLTRLGNVEAIDILVQALNDEDPEVLQSAVQSLSELGAQAVAPLIAALKGADQSGAAQALGHLGMFAYEPLLTAIEDKDAAIRAGAAQALGWIGDAGALDVLLIAIQDEDAEVRASAAWAIGWIGDPSGVESLRTALKDNDVDVVVSAIGGLAHIGDDSVLDELDRLASNPDFRIASAAKAAWGQLQPDDSGLFGRFRRRK
ncbi:MAG: HEAT repeat domain-containing protein [Chloroflexi bacterium]|nr:HEAT repeat domain-containing protein [Chloroflexota bacterium]